MPPRPVIVWFREDLRLDDHPALTAAWQADAPLLCVYVHDEAARSDGPHLRAPGGASRWWLDKSLAALDASLRAIGGALHILRGDARALIPALARAARASAVHWSRRYGAPEIALDTALKQALKDAGVEAHSHPGYLLHEPWTLTTKSGDPFRVFTPYWRAALAAPSSAPLAAPARLAAARWPADAPPPVTRESLGLHPRAPDWSGGLAMRFAPGERGAQARLAAFIDGPLTGYAQGRDFADRQSTSLLSPHLHFGEISPRRVAAAIRHAADSGAAPARDTEKFLAELGWREFSWHLLFHNPSLATQNFSPRFDAFPWRDAASAQNDIAAWRAGRTGYPIVDAGMRELWRTGYMHNRVRMIVASFLVKHLLIDWRIGEAWFWDTLCDADAANNAASWQWVAGSGADAAPYFRIFNPMLQGARFDPDGAYVRAHVPELASLPARHIHAPWTAPEDMLREARIALGKDYPAPIVPHDAARQRALDAFAATKA